MTNFVPALWREDPVPENVKGCCDCGLNQQGTRMVWAEGNPQSPRIPPGAQLQPPFAPFSELWAGTGVGENVP